MKYDVAHLRAVLDDAWPRGTIVADHTEDEHWYRNTETGRRAASVTTKQGFVSKPWLKPWYIRKTVDYIDANRARCEAGEWEAVLAEAKKAAGKSVEQAGIWGTTAHNAIDRYCEQWIVSGRAPESSLPFLYAIAEENATEAAGEEIAACRSFDKCIAEREVIPLASEIKVWYEVCPKHNKKECPESCKEDKDCFAGTVDSVLLWLQIRKGREGQTTTLDGSIHAHDYTEQETGVWWCVCGREVEPKLILGDWKTSNSINNKDDYAQQTTAYARAIERKTGLKFDDIYVFRFHKEYADYEIRRVDDPEQAWQEFLCISRAFDCRAKRLLGDGRNYKTLLVPLEVKQPMKI